MNESARCSLPSSTQREEQAEVACHGMCYMGSMAKWRHIWYENNYKQLVSLHSACVLSGMDTSTVSQYNARLVHESQGANTVIFIQTQEEYS